MLINMLKKLQGVTGLAVEKFTLKKITKKAHQDASFASMMSAELVFHVQSCSFLTSLSSVSRL